MGAQFPQDVFFSFPFVAVCASGLLMFTVFFRPVRAASLHAVYVSWVTGGKTRQALPQYHRQPVGRLALHIAVPDTLGHTGRSRWFTGLLLVLTLPLMLVFV